MTTVEAAPTSQGEQSRARYPDEDGYIERDGVRVFWESYGQGEQTLLLLPPWSIVHSRVWKMQIPYFARHFRVVVFAPRGNGRSDRPRDPRAYAAVAVGRSDRPLPRPSKASTRKWRAKYGICAFHTRECTSVQVGMNRIVWSPWT